VSGDAHPPLEELVPHSGGMLLLSRVLSHGAEETRCAAPVVRSHLFADAAGRVPAWVGLEYMAQCVAARGGLQARARGAAAPSGLFLGSRRLELGAESFAPDAELEVSARPVRGEGPGLRAFDCQVSEPGGGRTLVSGRINVYVAESADALGGTR
jgi:predicted hotdog family 3-hydroxylacyl-ACP dehydratase